MVASLEVLDSQEELDEYLDREHRLPVGISAEGPLPHGNANYDPIRALSRAGLSFRLRELLHAVGSKVAALPLNDEDFCLRAAFSLLVSLDLSEKHLCFRGDIDSDLQTPRSQEIGIGVTCLIASQVLGIPWNQLGPIPSKGKRFDYRGRTSELTCILESKGTKYRDNQNAQIRKGLKKKEAHHDRGESYDVELIVSAHVGTRGDTPRILLADPPEDDYEWSFSEEADKFFRMRHYARVMQFIGAPGLARQLYLDSNDLRRDGVVYGYRDTLYATAETPEDRVQVGGVEFVGSRFNSPVPDSGDRYRHLRTRRPRVAPVDSRILVFQGIREDRLELIRNREVAGFEIPEDAGRIVTQQTTTGETASIFPDGSILFFTLGDS